MDEMKIREYWDSFLATLPSDSPYREKTYVAEGFGDHPKLADELGALIVSGIKTGAPRNSGWRSNSIDT